MIEAHQTDVEHWLYRANEARAQAEEMSDRLSRRLMAEIAESYFRMAQRALERRGDIVDSGGREQPVRP